MSPMRVSGKDRIGLCAAAYGMRECARMTIPRLPPLVRGQSRTVPRPRQVVCALLRIRLSMTGPQRYRETRATVRVVVSPYRGRGHREQRGGFVDGGRRARLRLPLLRPLSRWVSTTGHTLTLDCGGHTAMDERGRGRGVAGWTPPIRPPPSPPNLRDAR